MKAGEFDRRIVIQNVTITRGEGGGEEKSWSTYTTIWAKREYKTGNEGTEADQTVSSNIAVWTIHYDSAKIPDATMRIKDGSNYYEIKAVQEIGRKEGFKLITEIKD